MRVAINGFGRIGRLAFRMLLNEKNYIIIIGDENNEGSN